MKCSICELRVKKDHETVDMADGGKCHKICFDIVCTGLAADIDVVISDENETWTHDGMKPIKVHPGNKVIFGTGAYTAE